MLSAEEADTLQTLEIFAVVWAISHFREPINVVTDSLYVAGVVARIEDAFIKEVRNQRLYQLLMQLNKALHQREQPYAVIHIRSHKWNIGLGEGNQRADELVSTAITVPLPQHVLAREAHSIFHQNAKGLQKEFHISHAEATAIVRSCPICCHHNGGLGLGTGVNPRGVMANELWQTDVTHVNSFGRLKYVHVTIDTYSHYIWATPQSASASHDRVTKYYRSENDMSDALEGTSTMYAKEGNNNHARGALPLARKRHGKTVSFGQCGFNGLVHQSQSCVEVAGKVEKGQLAA
ncbi:hypothetical protein DUI87_34440 [Hirundo rustica rustica]|uniref:RNA-directed DNA polymerase n=1 Tax=Hirundo rustica rustica TaxID=333673 RepID=A0A3M0IL77_HIRRU|nr:hypothetical protein DUI87_34440 [Hirundo rustica rustica]